MKTDRYTYQKELIHEKFGDDIMNAIDFSLHIDKERKPLGDHVVVAMNGKFPPDKAWWPLR